MKDPDQPFWDKLETALIYTRKELNREEEIKKGLQRLPLDIIKYVVLLYECEWSPYEIGFEIWRTPYWYYQPYDYQPYPLFPVTAVSREVMEENPERFYPEQYKMNASEKRIFECKMIRLYLLNVPKQDWYLTHGDLDRCEWIERQNRINESWDLFYHRLTNGRLECRADTRCLIWKVYIDEEWTKQIQVKYSYRYAVPFIWFKVPTDTNHSVRLELVYIDEVLYSSKTYVV